MMSWDEVKQRYRNQWVLVEAIEAITVNKMRQIDHLRVLETFPDFRPGWLAYQTLHRAQPKRELYVLHTQRERLDIEVAQSMRTPNKVG